MGAEEYRINRGVKSILTRHWVDTSHILFQTSGGVVRFRGILATTGDQRGSFDASLMEIIAAEVRAISGVCRVIYADVEIAPPPKNKKKTLFER